MKIDIDINRTDYWNYNKYMIFNIPKIRNTYIILLIAFPVFIIVLLSILLNNTITIYFSIFTGFFIGIIADIFWLYLVKRQIMRFPDNKEGFLGKHTIEITESGVKELTSVNEGFTYWKGIKEIRQDKNNIYVIVDTLIAHIIPKRSFSSENEAIGFYNKSLEYWTNNNK